MALAADRNTPRLSEPGLKEGGVAATTLIYAGALVMRNSSGYLTKGATATTLIGVGRAEERVNNTGSAGDKTVKVREGVFRFGNSSSSDLITFADIGKPCYAVDDETVAKTSGTNTRSIAGFVYAVDAQGVWVEFSEQKVQAHLAGIANPA
jgi:hypothetical protein